jgi:pyruvate/2-oxoglutarate dehydrogenase complex dihydrolipoamide dehydrogenase (E3) component
LWWAGQELPLKGFDEECRKLILEQYQLRGTKVHGNSSPVKVVKNSDGRLTVHVEPKDGDPYTIDEV